MCTPWLTVIIPTYNGCPHLVDALESLCHQDCEAFSVVAVDDGSTDETKTVLSEYSRKLPLRVIEREHGGNWIANTNVGMSIGDGRYIGWLHQDDLWEPNRVGTLRRLSEESPAAPMLFHPSWYVDDQGGRQGVWRCPLGRKTGPLSSDLVRERLLVQNFLAASAVIFRREVIEEVGFPDEGLWYTGDWDYWLRIVGIGDPVFCSFPMSSFRVHDQSQTSTRRNQQEELRRQYEVTLARHLHDRTIGSCTPPRTEALARFSVDANLFLMRCAEGCRQGAWRMLLRFAALGPIGWYVFFRDSRIIERLVVRIRASRKRTGLGGVTWH